MKFAAGLIAAGLVAPGARALFFKKDDAVTAQEKISEFDDGDFMYELGGPFPDNLVDGLQFRGVTLSQLPALQGQGISMALVNLDPCTINLPHIHPRATEMMYVIRGNKLRVAFVEENGGDGAVVNELTQGDVTFFPQGLIHYEHNLDCEPATFLAALGSEDPGAVTVTTRFFELPTEALKASLNFEDDALKNLIESLPELPAAARRECLVRCGLDDDDADEEDDDEYSYDYWWHHKKSRNLRRGGE